MAKFFAKAAQFLGSDKPFKEERLNDEAKGVVSSTSTPHSPMSVLPLSRMLAGPAFVRVVAVELRGQFCEGDLLPRHPSLRGCAKKNLFFMACLTCNTRATQTRQTRTLRDIYIHVTRHGQHKISDDSTKDKDNYFKARQGKMKTRQGKTR